MAVKEKAVRGFAKRMQGREASRLEALIAGAAVGFAVYKLLRSGSDDDSSDTT